MDRSKLLARRTTFVAREFLDGDERELTPTTPLLEWGVLDSMSMLALLAFVEDELEIRIPDEAVRPESFQNLDRLATLLAKLAGTPTPAPANRRTPASVVSRVANAGQGVLTLDVATGPGRTRTVAHAPGARPGMLLVSDPLNPSMSWGSVLRLLVGETATWSPPLVGLGPDDDGSDAPGFDAQVDALVELVTALGSEPLVLVGQGLGGALAARVAQRAPDRVAGLVVVNFGVLDDAWAWWQSLLALAETPQDYLTRALVEPRPLPAVLLERTEARLESHAFRTLLTEADAASLDTVFDGLDRLQIPTLFVGGLEDSIVPRRAVEAAAARVPGSQTEWLARCGHLAHLERAQELLHLIRAFRADHITETLVETA